MSFDSLRVSNLRRAINRASAKRPGIAVQAHYHEVYVKCVFEDLSDQHMARSLSVERVV